MAAADAAEGNGDPPPELEMAWDAESFGLPPYSGARADQPAGLLTKMRVLSNYFNAMKAARRHAENHTLEAFHSDPLFSLYIKVMKLREQYG